MILVSACLAGMEVRYNGSCFTFENETFKKLLISGQAILFCPELVGGLVTPRNPAEIKGGDGDDVLLGRAGVYDLAGEDITRAFVDGSRAVERIIDENQIKFAVLKEGSPSCGSSKIYDGSFSGVQKKGKGVFTAFLNKKGVRVFSENNAEELFNILNF